MWKTHKSIFFREILHLRNCISHNCIFKYKSIKSGIEKRNREECKRTRLVFELSFDDRVISSSLEEIRGADRSITLPFYRGGCWSFRSWDWIRNDSPLRCGFTSCPNSGHVKESFVFTSRCRVRSAAAPLFVTAPPLRLSRECIMTEPIDDARGVRCHISCRAAENMDAFKWTPRYTRRRKTAQFKNSDDSWQVPLMAELTIIRNGSSGVQDLRICID